MPLPRDEDIVRAICSDKWDEERLSPSLFTGSGTSVSRLSIVPLEDHWEMFRANVQKPPDRMLKLIGEINVGVLEDIGLCYTLPTKLTVEPKPVSWNPAHAEIPENITRGLANKILPALTLHRTPAGFGHRQDQ